MSLQLVWRLRLLSSLMSMQRPVGVTAIAIAFFLSALYRGRPRGGHADRARHGVDAGSVHLSRSISCWLVRTCFWSYAVVGAFIGSGLLFLYNFARRTAAIVAALGVVMLVPSVSVSGDYVERARTDLGRAGCDRACDYRVVSVAAAGGGRVRKI